LGSLPRFTNRPKKTPRALVSTFTGDKIPRVLSTGRDAAELLRSLVDFTPFRANNSMEEAHWPVQI